MFHYGHASLVLSAPAVLFHALRQAVKQQPILHVESITDDVERALMAVKTTEIANRNLSRSDPGTGRDWVDRPT
jgi:hypothetical protein